MTPSLLGVTLEFDGSRREFYYASNPLEVPGTPTSAKPVALLLHPFGGDAASMARDMRALWAAGFHVIAPEGVSHSWNAGECCGDALALGLNDTAFASAAAREGLDLVLDSPWPSPHRRVLVAGWSNGGWLASLIGLRAASGDAEFEWVGAVASLAGTSQDPAAYAAASSLGEAASPVPVLVAHGSADRAVLPGGCCPSQPQCCCGISKEVARRVWARGATTCVSARFAALDRAAWAGVNGCGTGQADVFKPDPRVSCVAAVGCRAPAAVCEYAGVGHAVHIVAAPQVVDFACEVLGGCLQQQQQQRASQSAAGWWPEPRRTASPTWARNPASSSLPSSPPSATSATGAVGGAPSKMGANAGSFALGFFVIVLGVACVTLVRRRRRGWGGYQVPS